MLALFFTFLSSPLLHHHRAGTALEIPINRSTTASVCVAISACLDRSHLGGNLRGSGSSRSCGGLHYQHGSGGLDKHQLCRSAPFRLQSPSSFPSLLQLSWLWAAYATLSICVGIFGLKQLWMTTAPYGIGICPNLEHRHLSVAGDIPLVHLCVFSFYANSFVRWLRWPVCLPLLRTPILVNADKMEIAAIPTRRSSCPCVLYRCGLPLGAFRRIAAPRGLCVPICSFGASRAHPSPVYPVYTIRMQPHPRSSCFSCLWRRSGCASFLCGPRRFICLSAWTFTRFKPVPMWIGMG